MQASDTVKEDWDNILKTRIKCFITSTVKEVRNFKTTRGCNAHLKTTIVSKSLKIAF